MRIYVGEMKSEGGNEGRRGEGVCVREGSEVVE